MPYRLKTTETLLGIETMPESPVHYQLASLKTTETLLGIETGCRQITNLSSKGLKTTETLLGIETNLHLYVDLRWYHASLKTTETLLGIETQNLRDQQPKSWESQNYWNPFRDWNSLSNCTNTWYLRLKTTETLLGIETQWYSFSYQRCL